MLSIITPTYNRAHTLSTVCESLKRQSNKNFEWVIVDDGSIDDTDIIVKKFFDCDNGFEIKYYKKENGGKHTALNLAYQYISGEVVLILDSDDYLTDYAVETISADWEKYKNDYGVCGLSYLKGYSDGGIIGDKFPFEYYIASSVDCRINKNVRGDKAEVFRSELLKQNPFPVFKDEMFLGESVVWTALGYKYKTVHINKLIYLCEYLETGLTKSGRALRIRCPKGGMLYAKTHINKMIKLKVRLKMAVLYLCYSHFDGMKYKNAIKGIKGFDFLFFLSRSPAFLLYKYWKKKYGGKV